MCLLRLVGYGTPVVFIHTHNSQLIQTIHIHHFSSVFFCYTNLASIQLARVQNSIHALQQTMNLIISTLRWSLQGDTNFINMACRGDIEVASQHVAVLLERLKNCNLRAHIVTVQIGCESRSNTFRGRKGRIRSKEQVSEFSLYFIQK